MNHYVPASLENLMEVAAYVLDEANDDEMRAIVNAANMWCKRKMTRDVMAKDMMLQQEKYKAALDDGGYNYSISSNQVKELDLVEYH